MQRNKCIIILSNKSSGSSACQNLLAKVSDVRHVRKTRHYQNETLYWTKAASILGLHQEPMLDSEVPIPAVAAREDLLALLRDNLSDADDLPADDRSLVFEGWRRLCREYAPVFLEKSPHHLCQRACLDLILEAERELPEVDFCLIGLIRNPMDQLYSAYTRWRTVPELYQLEWLRACRNLCDLQERADRLVVLRYEDMVRDPTVLQPVLDFIEVGWSLPASDYLHTRSVQRWKSDPWFGFQLAPEVRELAIRLGYTPEELDNRSRRLWPVARRFTRTLYKAATPARKLARALLRRVRPTAST